MLNFIVNPLAGGVSGKRSKQAIETIREYLINKDISFRFYFTNKVGHATEITKQIIDEGGDNVIAIGGDGTLHEVINGFSNFENVTMGIIPCGTGNDFVSAIGLPMDIIEALELILKGNSRYFDFMQLPTVRALNVVGMGIDVDVLKRYSKLKKKTKFGYTKCLVKSLCSYKYDDFEISLDDGESEHRRAFITAVANGHCFGGGIAICPTAKPDDKMLDCVSVASMNKLKVIGAFIKLKKGKVLSLKQTVHKQAKKVVVKMPIPYTVNADGELYDNIPFEVEIVSDKLKIFI